MYIDACNIPKKVYATVCICKLYIDAEACLCDLRTHTVEHTAAHFHVQAFEMVRHRVILCFVERLLWFKLTYTHTQTQTTYFCIHMTYSKDQPFFNLTSRSQQMSQRCSPKTRGFPVSPVKALILRIQIPSWPNIVPMLRWLGVWTRRVSLLT